MGGAQAAQDIRRLGRIPIVFVTAYAAKELLERARVAEPCGYILRPFEEHELRAAIEAVLYKHQIEQELQEQVRRTEEALALLQKEKDFSDAAIESLPGIFYLFDKAGTFLRWNKNFEQVSGYTAQEVARMHPLDFFDPDDKPLIEERIREGFTKGQAAVEVNLLAKDGRKLPYFFTGKLAWFGANECLVGMGVDVANRRRLEEQYRQAQKMEAVGRLAGGIAHDFNNLLTIMNGYCSILLTMLGDQEKARAMVEQIGKAGERAASLIRQLLAYSRRQILQPKVIDLNLLVNSLVKMVRPMIGEDIEMVTRLSGKPCTVKADPGQIEQVIMNLVVNARDAMPGGGNLTIETSHVDLTESALADFSDAHPGPYIQLAVIDTGMGMTKATLARLFEPFFTTKEQGKGTGLGLATVFGIVKQSGGQVRVHSELGRGATFQIFLPYLKEDHAALPADLSMLNLARGTETILFVEDEQAMHSVAHFILQRAGYTILTAANGTLALDVAARHSGPIDLLVTNVVMPGMGGRQLAESLRQTRPNLRVLFVSGYTEDAAFRKGIADRKHAFLQKPYTFNVLTRKIREVLDSP